MALSVGAIGSIGQYTAIKPLNYALSNNSRVSDAYQKSVQSENEIDLVNPVRYPNARTENVKPDPAAAVSRAQQTDREFNAIASRFASAPTGYQADSSASAYSLIGSGFDAIA